jgi:DNA-binding MarR family transcriptional regulator
LSSGRRPACDHEDRIVPPDNQPLAVECNCLALRAAARHVTQFYDQVLAPSGLRTTQFSILAMLKRNGPQAINALADELVMDRTTLGRNILPLQRDGLIRIDAAAADRRAKMLVLTETGAQRVRAAAKLWYAAQARFDAVFGAKRAADLRALMASVVASDFAVPDAAG